MKENLENFVNECEEKLIVLSKKKLDDIVENGVSDLSEIDAKINKVIELIKSTKNIIDTLYPKDTLTIPISPSQPNIGTPYPFNPLNPNLWGSTPRTGDSIDPYISITTASNSNESESHNTIDLTFDTNQ